MRIREAISYIFLEPDNRVATHLSEVALFIARDPASSTNLSIVKRQMQENTRQADPPYYDVQVKTKGQQKRSVSLTIAVSQAYEAKDPMEPALGVLLETYRELKLGAPQSNMGMKVPGKGIVSAYDLESRQRTGKWSWEKDFTKPKPEGYNPLMPGITDRLAGLWPRRKEPPVVLATLDEVVVFAKEHEGSEIGVKINHVQGPKNQQDFFSRFEVHVDADAPKNKKATHQAGAAEQAVAEKDRDNLTEKAYAFQKAKAQALTVARGAFESIKAQASNGIPVTIFDGKTPITYAGLLEKIQTAENNLSGKK